MKLPESIPVAMGKNKRPAIDLGACSKCLGCLEIAPAIFRFSESGNYVEVCDLDFYDQEAVGEAIKYCPEDCIYWEDGQ